MPAREEIAISIAAGYGTLTGPKIDYEPTVCAQGTYADGPIEVRVG